MVGRGAVANPALLRRLRGGAALSEEELTRFLERLLAAFKGALGRKMEYKLPEANKDMAE